MKINGDDSPITLKLKDKDKIQMFVDVNILGTKLRTKKKFCCFGGGTEYDD